ncbi:MAG: neutral/alkaline non-lysosomal ceramidase N-terminal domain-containing protein, partial [Planctomycetes bacterium]|nr:neutral/alkaline non-lysosomal ceramidase N-terminal domain-containing protein [Planctomycetota bacterium]
MPQVDTPQGACRFGIARGDITPPVGIYHRMWGAATHDRSEGVHRPLTATAAVFQPADATSEAPALVLVSLDHCLLWASEMRDFLSTVAERTGLSADELVVTFSHTHGAGLMGHERVELPGGELIGPYLARVAETVATLVHEAFSSFQSVNIVYGFGRCSLTAHRDYWDEAAGQFACGFNPAGAADDTVLLARLTDAAGQTVATVVNYACHPTTLAWQNRLISPDYPGAMRELVERETGAPCLFLQGASGDLGPREGFVGDVQVADRNGRELGFAALSVLTALPAAGTTFAYAGPVVSGATLGTWAHLPIDADAAARHRAFRVRRWTVDLPYRADLPT